MKAKRRAQIGVPMASTALVTATTAAVETALTSCADAIAASAAGTSPSAPNFSFTFPADAVDPTLAAAWYALGLEDGGAALLAIAQAIAPGVLPATLEPLAVRFQYAVDGDGVRFSWVSIDLHNADPPPSPGST